MDESGSENTEELHFFYDAQSRPAFVEYNGVKYRYVHNLQGDIVGIVDAAGNLVVVYRYDAWGKPLNITGSLADTLGKRNPFRYRGYVYDEETELYYLRSRYYDADRNRFINSDGYITTGSGQFNGNTFIYCNNTPASLIDPDGTSVLTAIIAVATITYAIIKSGILGYGSADAAAKAFSEKTYGASKYIRHEYGTQIYTRKIFGLTRYYYAKPVAGSPHSVAPGNAVVPNGVTVVAVAHTHPNSNQFSDSDKKYALTRAVDIYVVGPDLNLQKFDFSSQNTMIVGTICPVALSNEQKQQLKAAFQASWDAHIINGVCNKDFSCGTMTWPTE